MGACTSTKRRFEPNRLYMPYKVQVHAIIWPKNQHNLFDFESTAYTNKEIEIDFSAQLATVDKELVALTKNEWARSQTELTNLVMEATDIHLVPISTQQDHRLWVVIKSEGSQFNSIRHYDVKLNDTLKLGRVRMQLIEYAFMKPYDEMTQYQEEQDEDVITLLDQAACRFCFSSRASEVNPLLSPCQCGGSVKYIHLECLQKWIAVQLKIKQGDHYIQYVWKRLECEICKNPFSNTYTFGTKIYPVVKIPKPKSSYLTFKVTNDDKSKEGMIYVIEVGEKTELRIGRIPDCEIKLRDISVSRQHAMLKLIPTDRHTPENPDYTIRVIDNKSKFGTLVYAQHEEMLKIPMTDEAQPVLYQTGRVLLQFKCKQKTNQKAVYRHPDSVPLFQVEMKQLQDEQVQVEESFETHNELNQEDIIMTNKKPIPQDVDMSVADEI